MNKERILVPSDYENMTIYIGANGIISYCMGFLMIFDECDLCIFSLGYLIWHDFRDPWTDLKPGTGLNNWKYNLHYKLWQLPTAINNDENSSYCLTWGFINIWERKRYNWIHFK